jgi:hypothetical protein
MSEESIKSAIGREIKRLGDALHGFTDEGAKELVKAFRDCATTAESVHRVGDRLMATCEYFPVPKQVYDASESMAQTVPEFTGIERTSGDSGGALDDYLTAEQLEKWQHVLEHSENKHARDIARVILDRHTRPKAEVAHG